MATDFEVEEGREVVRRTIVGGRPRAREKRKIRVPIGLEKVLCRAAGDAAFRQALLLDRDRAVDEAGWELLPTERAVLGSVPAATLETMIASIDVQQHGRKRFMAGVMAAAFAATALATDGGCVVTGSEPDEPPGDVVEDVAFGDAAATRDATIVPDADPSRGISPDSVVWDIGEPVPAGILPDAWADSGAPDIITMPDITAEEGIRPDIVLDAEDATVLGILPDIEDLDTAEVDVLPPAPTGILPDIDE